MRNYQFFLLEILLFSTLIVGFTITSPKFLVQTPTQWSAAMFGVPYLSQKCLKAKLVLSNPIVACSPLITNIPKNERKNTVIFVARGTCTFVQKAQFVEEAGFAGLIVWNTADDDNINTMSDDGSNRNIKIRSVMIPYKTGLTLFRHMKSHPTHAIKINFGQCKNHYTFYA